MYGDNYGAKEKELNDRYRDFKMDVRNLEKWEERTRDLYLAFPNMRDICDAKLFKWLRNLKVVVGTTGKDLDTGTHAYLSMMKGYEEFSEALEEWVERVAWIPDSCTVAEAQTSGLGMFCCSCSVLRMAGFSMRRWEDPWDPSL